MTMTAVAEATRRARTFTGAALREVAFPLGGIGTGTVSLGGRGELRDWEIFNRPAKGRSLPFTFFALWAQPSDGKPIARVLERQLLPPFVADRGLPPWGVAGLPRLREATFGGTYPIAEAQFHDDLLPLRVELEAYSPFAPFDDRLSGMPVAIFIWRLTNPGSAPVDATLVYSQFNPIGYDGIEHLGRGRRSPMLGGNLNEWTDEGARGPRGIRMSRPRFDDYHPGAGTLAIILLLASLMVPYQVTIIPVFIIMKNLGLADNHLSLILIGLTSAFGVFLLRQFFMTVSQDLIDAAKIDGAGPWTIFTRIALPLAGPSLSALAIITFNNTWNNYFYPLIFLTSWDKMTLPLGITALRGYLSSGNASVVMAAVALTILPVLLVFLLAQRWIIQGVTQSGIKG